MSEASLVTEDQLAPNLKQLWLKAVAATEAKNYGYAVTILQSILQQEPSFLYGRKLMRGAAVKEQQSGKKGRKGSGITLSQAKSAAKKDPAEGLVTLEKVLGDDPYNTSANEFFFEIATQLGMQETATFALETIFEGDANHKNKKIGHRLAEHYLLNNQPEKAANVYNIIVKRDPSDLKAVKGATDATARASMKQGGWSEKSNIQDLKHNTKDAASIEDDSRTAMTREQIDAALSRWGDKYAEDPNDISVVKRIAQLYEQKEDLASACSYYEWAFQLNSADVAIETKIQRLKDKIRDLEISNLKADIEKDNDAPDITEKQARLEELISSRAVTVIKEARERVERNPTDLQLRFELGIHLFESGDYSEAIQELQRAKTSPHIRTRVLLTLGKCFEAKNMNDLAVTQLEAAVSELHVMDTTKKDILYTLALVLEKTGEKAKYLEALKQIYETDYGYKDVAHRVESSYGEQ